MALTTVRFKVRKGLWREEIFPNRKSALKDSKLIKKAGGKYIKVFPNKRELSNDAVSWLRRNPCNRYIIKLTTKNKR